MSSSMRSLLPAAGMANMADQMMLVALPLLASLLLGASPQMVSLLVAMHSAAWLAISLPSGAVIDRFDRRWLLIGSQLVGALGYGGAWIAIRFDSLAGLMVAAFFGSCGIVLFVLTTTAVLPAFIARAGLAGANARLELARGIAAIAAPAAVALLADHAAAAAAGPLAAMCAVVAACCLWGLPTVVPQAAARPRLAAAIRDGARFVLGHPLLRALGLCAIFWNFAFFVLAGSFVPYALQIVGLPAASVVASQAAYGAGALLAALSGGWLVGERPPNHVLVFGPAASLVAGGLILAAPLAGSAVLHGVDIPAALMATAVGYFLIGFGPVLWLICQTTVRQLVTPHDMIGRVSATIQTAIYGMRPLGALCGAAVAAAWGPAASIGMATAAFALSLAVVAASPLCRLSIMPVPAE